jgi:Raf kinase inhibitor-like YbhB/YbcL family protein
MRLWSDSFSDNGKIPGKFAFCVIDPETHASLSDNRNPHLAWSGVPSGTKSLAVICLDVDVPSRGDDVNQEARLVPASLPRVDFFHWALIELPPTITSIAEGEFSSSVTPRGKSGPTTKYGARHGINDFFSWFAGDPDMSGEYFGYDGPCPPWNDSILHHYVFTVYALDLAKLPIDGKFTCQQALDVLKNHVLAEAKITGIYTLNPALAK